MWARLAFLRAELPLLEFAVGQLKKRLDQLMILMLCLGAAPAAYAFFSRTTMNLREKEDAWAAAFGGFVSGGVLGLPCTYLKHFLRNCFLKRLARKELTCQSAVYPSAWP